MTAEVYGLPAPPAEPEQPVTLLDGLLADLAGADTIERTTLSVPARPGYEVRYRLDLPWEQLVMMRTAAADSRQPGGVDELQLCAATLVACCEAIVKDGEDVVDGAEPVTFAHSRFQQALGASTATEAVRRLYRKDGHVQRSGTKVLASCGYGPGGTPTER